MAELIYGPEQIVLEHQAGDAAMKNSPTSENGQSLILIALSMTVLMGFLGLAIDVGVLYRTKQNAQIAADAAAVAGAQNLMYGGTSTTAQTAGKNASAANGYTDGSSGVTVVVNTPPATGPNAKAGFVEAIVAKSKGMSFAAVLGRKSTTVAARAVAGTPVYGNACIWLMAPSGMGLAVQGSYHIDVGSCGIYVNSPDANAIGVTGNSGYMKAKFLDAVGNVTPQHQTTPTPITKNTAPRKNPWGNLSGPSVPSGCTSTFPTTGTSAISVTTTNNATYKGTATNKVVCFTQAVTANDGVYFPGADQGVTYVFENGLTIATGATVTFGASTYNASTNTFSNTTGATIELYGGTLNQQSNSILNMYAPTAGPMNGIGIYQPTTNTTDPLQVQFGSNSQMFDGYVYALNTTVYLQDSGGTGVKDMGIVAKAMNVQTANFVISSYDSANAGTTPNRIVSLVE